MAYYLVKTALVVYRRINEGLRQLIVKVAGRKKWISAVVGVQE